ncbi:MAG: hypothetical protein ACR2PG_17495 [Hyphomicrobiaceae bacterium]
MKFDRFAVFAKGGRIYGAGTSKDKAMADAQRNSNIELKLFDLKTSKNFDDLNDGELACMPCTAEVARTKRDYVVTPSGLQSNSEIPRRRSRFFLPADRTRK